MTTANTENVNFSIMDLYDRIYVNNRTFGDEEYVLNCPTDKPYGKTCYDCVYECAYSVFPDDDSDDDYYIYCNRKFTDILDGWNIKTDRILDIVKNEGEDTIECIIESTTSLKCDTKITTGELSTLPSYTLKRSGSSGLIWKNAQENDDFFYFILETTLDFNKADRMTFISNKWKFNLETSNFPAKYKIIIDILYDAGASTATCIKEITKTSCEVDKGGQSNSATIKIKKVGFTVTIQK